MESQILIPLFFLILKIVYRILLFQDCCQLPHYILFNLSYSQKLLFLQECVFNFGKSQNVLGIKSIQYWGWHTCVKWFFAENPLQKPQRTVSEIFRSSNSGINFIAACLFWILFRCFPLLKESSRTWITFNGFLGKFEGSVWWFYLVNVVKKILFVTSWDLQC